MLDRLDRLAGQEGCVLRRRTAQARRESQRKSPTPSRFSRRSKASFITGQIVTRQRRQDRKLNPIGHFISDIKEFRHDDLHPSDRADAVSSRPMASALRIAASASPSGLPLVFNQSFYSARWIIGIPR